MPHDRGSEHHEPGYFSLGILRTVALAAPAIFFVIAVLTKEWKTAISLSVFFVLAASAIIFRRGRDHGVTLHLLILFLVAHQTNLLYHSTDVANIGLIWHMTVPPLVALLGNRWHIVIWTPIILSIVIWDWYLYRDYPSMAHPLSLFNLIGVTLVLSVAAYGVISQRDRRQKSLRQALEASQAESRQREEAEREATEANAAITRFLGSISHEMRTPLASIVASAEVIEQSGSGGEDQRWTRNIKESADSLLMLLNDVLELASSDSGKTRIAEERFDVEALLQSVTAIVQPMAQISASFLFVGATPDTFAQRVGDAPRIRQVLVNLINNGLQHSGGTRVWLMVSDHDDHLDFEVGDDGKGIAPEHHQSIFKPFYQVSGHEHHADQKGTGLGLAICKGYVEAMGGKIQLESRLDEGTRFLFSIPAPPAGKHRLRDLNPPNTKWPEKVSLSIPCENVEHWAKQWLDVWGIESVEQGRPLSLPAPSARGLITFHELTSQLVDHDAQPAEAQGVSSEGSKGLKILMCDDDEIILEAFAEMFRRRGHATCRVASGADLVARLSAEHYDVVVLDLNLSGESGINVLKQVRGLQSDKARVPVCILSGSWNQRENCLDAGAQLYLTKPCTSQELIDAVESLAIKDGVANEDTPVVRS
ncbi:MAG: ATP-binding protein [Pseudomonadota bacterium]